MVPSRGVALFLLTTAATLLPAGLAPAAGEPREPPTARQLAAALAELNQGAHARLPPLSRRELEALLGGEVIRRKEPTAAPEQPERVFGVVLAAVPQEQLWIVINDGHFASGTQYSGKRLSAPGAEPVRSYGFLDLPWPFADRHWVIDITTNARLARASAGRCWERHWELDAKGEAAARKVLEGGSVVQVAPEHVAEVVYTPVNRGAWSVVALPGGLSLVAYQLTTVVGGDIPQGVVAEFALQSMRTLLTGIVEKARTVPGHYDLAHAAITGGTGKAIAPIPVRD